MGNSQVCFPPSAIIQHVDVMDSIALWDLCSVVLFLIMHLGDGQSSSEHSSLVLVP